VTSLSSPKQLKAYIKQQATSLGFQQCGVAQADIPSHVEKYKQWLKQGYHGDMGYMADREALRSDPTSLVPGTLSVISVRLNYVPTPAKFAETLEDSSKAIVSRYALGRDYHKLMRKKLAKLAKQLEQLSENLSYRVFVDSAPVLERAYGEEAGLGWIGKNTMLINESEGSFFFLGEILTNLPLEADEKPDNLCGKCTSCISICPTQAIVAPYTVDARKCISYLTIEHFGSIPESLRPLMGNRIYGCDDCQLVCPWNRYAKATDIDDFSPRHGLDNIELLELFLWSEETFLRNFEGSPIRRIGFERWQRNIAIALGNAEYSPRILEALNQCLNTTDSDLIKEHVTWAIKQQQNKKQTIAISEPDNNQQKLIRTTRKIVKHLE
jgi:epoxyqueuosine reductase